MSARNRRVSVARGAAAGAIAGAVASSAMIVFNHLLGASGFASEDLGRRQQHRRVDAKPNDADGTISDEPASEKLASNIAQAVGGAPLDERDKRIGGAVVHHAFGAAMGAVYGAIAARSPKVAGGAGLPFGAAVWLAGAESGLPIAGLSRSPASYPAARHAASLATHLVFGATLEAVWRGMTRR